MRPLLIGYDLNKPVQEYKELIDKIKKLFPKRWHCLDSTWIVKTSLTERQVRDALTPYVRVNDVLLVVGLTGEWASKGFNRECSRWLRVNL